MNNVIFIMTNGGYFKYTIPFLNSIKKNWAAHPEILCNHHELTDEQIDILKGYSNLTLIDVDDVTINKIENLPAVPARDSKYTFTYIKLNIWSDAYDKYDNILYLDVDTLVLRPMDDLLNAEDFTIFRDPTPLIFKSPDDRLRILLKEDSILHKLGDDLKAVIGNCGVMLIPKKVRNKVNNESMLYLLDRYKDYSWWGDQSIVNLWIIRDDLKITDDVKFNFLSIVFDYVDYNFDEIRLIHFVMKKPNDENFLGWNHIKDQNLRQKLFDLYKGYEKR